MERSSDFLVLFASAMMAQRLPRTTTSRPTRGSAADLGVRPTRQPNPHHFQGPWAVLRVSRRRGPRCRRLNFTQTPLQKPALAVISD